MKYLREENNTKNILFKRFWKTKKNIQIMPDYEPKSTNHFILPKKSSSNIKPPSSNQITASNSFDLLSENIENRLGANSVTSIGDNYAESFPY